MNTSKHTPGPWRISGCQLGKKLLIEHGNENTLSPVIGSVYLDDGRLPQEANAHLIAAAPAMYQSGTLTVDIMERVAKKLERKGLEELRALLRSAIIEQKQALAQAEGKDHR